ncbi:MAG: nitroreductase family protein [Promethearchaeota archaeon]
MEFDELVKKRRSIHYFTDEPVSNEDISHILEAARWAPSAGNNQPWRFIIVREPETIERIWETTTGIKVPISSHRSITVTPQNFIKKAPVIIVVCTDTQAYKGKQSNIFADRFCIQDSAITTMNLLLAAANRGLGACWVGMYREDALSKVIKLPPTIRPIAIIPLGHTTSQEKSRPRKQLEEFIHYERYGQK